MTLNEIQKRITDIEYELFISINKGHRPSIGYQYNDLRVEVNILRCLYFGNDSKFCKKTKEGLRPSFYLIITLSSFTVRR